MLLLLLYSQAVNGQAIDRHLLGMKLAALESRKNVPELFMDSSYQYALHYKLSTSQVSTPACLFEPDFSSPRTALVYCYITLHTLLFPPQRGFSGTIDHASREIDHNTGNYVPYSLRTTSPTLYVGLRFPRVVKRKQTPGIHFSKPQKAILRTQCSLPEI